MNTIISMIILAYVCGSLTSAVLICKLANLPDPFTNGSGNPGATNLLRLGSKLAAISTLIFDILKGIIPVWFSHKLGLTPFWLGIVAVSACIGHIYSLFLNFNGGKGVATALGAIIPIDHHLSITIIIVWLLIVLSTGYSSLGAIISSLITIIYVIWFKPQFAIPVGMISCLIIFRHYNNIKRLLHGEETRIYPHRDKDLNANGN